MRETKIVVGDFETCVTHFSNVFNHPSPISAAEMLCFGLSVRECVRAYVRPVMRPVSAITPERVEGF